MTFKESLSLTLVLLNVITKKDLQFATGCPNCASEEEKQVNLEELCCEIKSCFLCQYRALTLHKHTHTRSKQINSHLCDIILKASGR